MGVSSVPPIASRLDSQDSSDEASEDSDGDFVKERKLPVFGTIATLGTIAAELCHPYLHGSSADKKGQMADAEFISTCVKQFQRALLPLAPPLKEVREDSESEGNDRVLLTVTTLEDFCADSCKRHQGWSDEELLEHADDDVFIEECREKFRKKAAQKLADFDLFDHGGLIEHYTEKAAAEIQAVVDAAKERRRAGIHVPPEMWDSRDRSRGENPPEFIVRVYKEKLDGSFTRADLRRSDPKLGKALQNWSSYNNKDWPKDWPPLPTAGQPKRSTRSQVSNPIKALPKS